MLGKAKPKKKNVWQKAMESVFQKMFSSGAVESVDETKSKSFLAFLSFFFRFSGSFFSWAINIYIGLKSFF
jgi:hypothetical protein